MSDTPPLTRAQRQAARSSSPRSRSRGRGKLGRGLISLAIVVVLLVPLVLGGIWLYKKIQPNSIPIETSSVDLQEHFVVKSVSNYRRNKWSVFSQFRFLLNQRSHDYGLVRSHRGSGS